jgi:hypothetical protein
MPGEATSRVARYRVQQNCEQSVGTPSYKIASEELVSKHKHSDQVGHSELD